MTALSSWIDPDDHTNHDVRCGALCGGVGRMPSREAAADKTNGIPKSLHHVERSRSIGVMMQ